MTNDNADSANHETRAVISGDLRDVQHEAVMLHGLIEGIAHLDNDGQDNARTATIDIAMRLADQLAIRISDLGERKL